ncbi:hypothetical protein LSTR_LSTR010216 [Laodelphax striatellus]|uniref:Uncharacterized protein n=1 Tax=Laodelphax striatellus TaxID=195883 RepID=A0A482WPI6_LAOST|nr:hypothetical protein LSTR_LSTR010216 [Laodelphax striatellus]
MISYLNYRSSEFVYRLLVIKKYLTYEKVSIASLVFILLLTQLVTLQMPSPKTDSIVSSTRKRSLDVDFKTASSNDSKKVSTNDCKTVLFNDSKTVSFNESKTVSFNDSKNLSVNDSKTDPLSDSRIILFNDLKPVPVNDTPTASKNVLLNATTPAVDEIVSSNETPISPKLPHEGFPALFSCSTPLSAYKTPAKKKRLFTPGNSSGYVPVSSPTDSELLKADIDNSDVFLDGSCRSVVTDISDCTPLKTILDNCESVISSPLESIFNNTEMDERSRPLDVPANNDLEQTLSDEDVSGIDFLHFKIALSTAGPSTC